MTVLRRPVTSVLGLMLLAGCSSSTNPNTPALTSFVRGVLANDGTTAAQTPSGAPPAANGGPTLTATPVGASSASASVSNGGSSAVELRAASAFNQVFVSVIDGPLDGFLTLTLPAATTDTVVIIQLGGTIPVNTFQTVFSVKTPAGLVGPATSIANTVTPATVTSYQGVWNVGHTPTNETGACAGLGADPLNTFTSDGQTTVGSSGTFTYPGHHAFPGTMNLSSGAWSFSGNSGGCGTDSTGTISASGTCSSFTACSGSFSQTTSPSSGAESGTVTWSR